MPISIFEKLASSFYNNMSSKRMDSQGSRSSLAHIRSLKAPRDTQDHNDVLIERCLSGICEIRLNRPSKLNALNIDMCLTIIEYLKAWEKCSLAKLILIKGNGKAFCAGGDIKVVSDLSRSGRFKDGALFFEKNFSMEHLIGCLKTPSIVIMDGITSKLVKLMLVALELIREVGGGVGLCINSPFRIATENTVFSMPENAIGLFTDASASFWMPRLDGYIGHYLALTGRRLKGYDVFYIGIATHYVPAARLNTLEAELARLSCKSVGKVDPDEINRTIELFTETVDLEKPLFLDSDIRNAINRCFQFSTVEDIVAALQAETIAGEWARDSLKQLAKMSPTSLKISLQLFQLSASLSFTECMKLEYQLASKVLATNDFIEGTTAVLVTRTKPSWTPSTLEEVDLCRIRQFYFDSPISTSMSLLCDGGSYVHSPHNHFALPTCTDILEVEELIGREGSIQYFIHKYKGKQGLKAKISDVLNV